MEPIKKEIVKKQVAKAKDQTAQVKETVNKQVETEFIDSSVSQSKIVALDAAGKKLIFDIVEFPELSMSTLGKLSRANRIAYQMDLRYSQKAEGRMADGKSPYSEVKKQLESEDPLGVITEGSHFAVRNKDKNMKYLFPDPKNVDALIRAGYKLVPSDGTSGEVTHGVSKDGRTVILGDSGKVDNVAMMVDKVDYDKHMEIGVKKSQARLGQHLEETKERMKKYAPKVTIYDKSEMYAGK